MSITVADLKEHMRLDLEDTSEDALLTGKIAAAESWIESYIGSPLSTFENDVPAAVREAVRQLAAHLYENREATSYGTVSEIPFGVTSLLSPFRTWTF